MGSKFFDIPFLTKSDASDFSCKDGEVENAVGIEGGTDPEEWKANVPEPDIDFALSRDVLAGWHLIADSFPMKKVVGAEDSIEYWNGMASQVLRQFLSESENQRLFVSPFKVMAAWKTQDGDYLSASEAVTLIPNNDLPLIGSDSAVATEEMELKIAAAVCSLRLRMRAPELLRDFEGKITSLVIFVSSPLVKYDSYHAFVPTRRATTDNWCESLDSASGEIRRERVCTETLSLAWRGLWIREDSLEIGESLFYPFGEIALRDVDMADRWCRPEDVGGVTYGKVGAGIKYGEIVNSHISENKAGPLIIKGKGTDIKVTTRPLKLSGAGDLKGMRRVSLRGHYSPGPLTVSVYGSRDMLKWWCISKRKGGTMVMLPCSPFRFYKVSIEGILAEGESLEGITVS